MEVEIEYMVELPVLKEVEKLVLLDRTGTVAVVVYAYAAL